MKRIQAIQRYARLLDEAAAKSSEHLRLVKRGLCLHDLFYLLVFILKRKDVNRDWLFERCYEVQEEPDGFLDLWSREHYKSTIITFAKTIQDILRNPEVTFGIFSHTRPSAKSFLRQIKVEFEANDDLKTLFPDILWDNPQKEAPKWSEDEGIIVKRRSRPKESTIEAWGLVDAMPTGKHFEICIYDDVIELKSITNPDMVKKVITAWEMSLNLGKEGGTTRYVGTRYHFADPYREIIEREAAIPRIRLCTVEGTWPGTPTLMSVQTLTKKRRDMGIYTFSSQMLQDPTADKKMGFKEEWLRYHENIETADGMNVYMLCDPANAKKKDSDYTSIGIIGCGSDSNYYLLDGIRDRLGLRERGDAIFAFHKRWRPQAVGYEQYGMQADIEYIQDRMSREHYRFDITPLGGQVAKPDRIRRLVPSFEAGRWYLPDSLMKVDYEDRPYDVVQTFVEEEYKAFPVALHDDFFDMMARIMDEDMNVIWPKEPMPIKQDRYAKGKNRKKRTSSWVA